MKTDAEKNLLSAVTRVAKNSVGYAVLYLHISRLSIKYRRDEFVRVLGILLQRVVSVANGTLFALSNGDIAILGKDVNFSLAEEAFERLRETTSFVHPNYPQNIEGVIEIFGLPRRCEDFVKKIETQIAQVKNDNEQRPLLVSEIPTVKEKIKSLRVEDLVKRQSAIKFFGREPANVVFQEFFVAVKDLTAHIDKNINLTANRWLFSYLSQALDKRTMQSFAVADIKNWPTGISLNLNLKSVFTKEFITFAKTFLQAEQKLYIEVDLLDVFNDLNLYFKVKDILQKGGHKLIIDALNPNVLEVLNIETLKPDMLKVFWDGFLEGDIGNAKFSKTLEKIGKENIVLAKCNCQQAIDWGLSYGIKIFQGPFIDDFEVRTIMNKCPYAANCSPAECLKRKRLVSGAYRNQCRHLELLEGLLQNVRI